jgi:hypothetical protein
MVMIPVTVVIRVMMLPNDSGLIATKMRSANTPTNAIKRHVAKSNCTDRCNFKKPSISGLIRFVDISTPLEPVFLSSGCWLLMTPIDCRQDYRCANTNSSIFCLDLRLYICFILPMTFIRTKVHIREILPNTWPNPALYTSQAYK